MPDARSPVRHHLVLYRRDLEQGRARFFSLMIERDLFGTIPTGAQLGVVNSTGQGSIEIFLEKAQAAHALERRGPEPRGERDIRTFDEAPGTTADVAKASSLMSDTPSEFDQGQHLSCSDQN